MEEEIKKIIIDNCITESRVDIDVYYLVHEVFIDELAAELIKYFNEKLQK